MVFRVRTSLAQTLAIRSQRHMPTQSARTHPTNPAVGQVDGHYVNGPDERVDSATNAEEHDEQKAEQRGQREKAQVQVETKTQRFAIAI